MNTRQQTYHHGRGAQLLSRRRQRFKKRARLISYDDERAQLEDLVLDGDANFQQLI